MSRSLSDELSSLSDAVSNHSPSSDSELELRWDGGDASRVLRALPVDRPSFEDSSDELSS